MVLTEILDRDVIADFLKSIFCSWVRFHSPPLYPEKIKISTGPCPSRNKYENRLFYLNCVIIVYCVVFIFQVCFFFNLTRVMEQKILTCVMCIFQKVSMHIKKHLMSGCVFSQNASERAAQTSVVSGDKKALGIDQK